MRARFHAEPIVQATELLLQERTPRDVAVARPRADEVQAAGDVRELVPPVGAASRSPHGAMPRTHLLSNGRYAVMLTAAGSGYSRWRDLAVTRWREDATRDAWGTYVFLRDVDSGETLVGRLPADAARAGQLRGRRSPRTAREIVRRDGTITTTLEVVVSPEDDAEVRRVSLTNLGHADARDRADVVRRDRAGAAGRRRGPPGVLEAVRADRVRARRSARCSPRAGRGRAGEPPVWAAHVVGGRGRDGRRPAVRDRPRALPRPRARRSGRRCR